MLKSVRAVGQRSSKLLVKLAAVSFALMWLSAHMSPVEASPSPTTVASPSPSTLASPSPTTVASPSPPMMASPNAIPSTASSPSPILSVAAVAANSQPAPGTGVAPADAVGMKWLTAQVQKNIQEQIALLMNVPASALTVEVDSLKTYPEIADMNGAQVRVLGLGTSGSRRLDGLFTLNALVDRPNSQSAEIQLSGMLKVVGPVYVARKNINRNEIVSEDSLNLVQMPWRVLPTGAGGVSVKDLIGRSSRVMIPAGSPVYPDVLEQAMAIRPGDLIELTVMSGPGVIIRSRGVAKQEGRVGDTIKIEQPDTKKLLSGTVVGQKSAEVRL